jgi:hypothetical protein
MPDGGLSDADRAWLESRFNGLEAKVEKRDSKVQDLEIKYAMLNVGSAHKCTEAIEAHESKSWAHSPYKAGGLLVSIFGVVEGVKKFFGH